MPERTSREEFDLPRKGACISLFNIVSAATGVIGAIRWDRRSWWSRRGGSPRGLEVV
jgi:hypothetical protein